jgi:predicted AlkP superfamily pyrophosphatase or phosphodiesterase
MLPATNSHGPSLADVIPSCLASLVGMPNALDLPPAGGAVVLVVDGLGSSCLRARAGHARTLTGGFTAGSSMRSGFPTTTAAALTTLTTGAAPGAHGLVGYTVLDTDNDRVVNQLSGWDERLDPATWQRCRTLFEQSAHAGVASFAVGAARFQDSGFTRAVLRGAQYRAAETIEDRMGQARAVLDENPGALVYVYAAELDQAAHAVGWESGSWTAHLEAVDAAVRAFVAGLRRQEGFVVTADHGMLDVPARSHVLFDSEPGLVDGIRFVAGDPRCLQLHFEPDASEQHRASVLQRWREAEGGRSWVVSRAEAIEAGWFGDEVHPDVAARIGDILIAARKAIAYYDSRSATPRARNMVGQHGSFSPDELNVPLLKFGAYSRG